MTLRIVTPALLILLKFGYAKAQNKLTDMDIKDKIETLTTYIDAWNATSDIDRQGLLEKSFSLDGRYVDPHIPTPVKNLDEMKAIIVTFRSRLPHHLKMASEPEFHNYAFRIKWKMQHKDEVLSNGTFAGEFDSQNKIRNILCFIDK